MTRAKRELRIAGILLIVAGLFAFLQAAELLMRDSFVIGRLHADWNLGDYYLTDTSRSICGGLDILFGALVVFGGIHTIRRTRYSLSIGAAALAIISFGLLVSLILGIMALSIIIPSRDDFADNSLLPFIITIERVKKKEV